MTAATGSDPASRLSTGPATVRRGGGPARAPWLGPVALVLLTLIPMIAGSLRVIEIAGGPHVLPDNPRIDASPAPVVVHVVAAVTFALVGALQFSARLRRRHRAWHRRAGRVVAVAGLLVAGSGLWMTLFSADAPGGALLWTARLLAGTAVAAGLVLGVTAIRRRDVVAHRAWMIRAYALAVAAGTQTFTQGFGEAVFGRNDLSTGLSVSAGWVINAAVAEVIVRRPAARAGSR